MLNQADYGGGLVIDYTGALVKNNIICQNSCGSSYGGGGIWTIGNGPASVIIENNTIVENSSDSKGGAMYIWSSAITARNNIIWGNTQSSGNPIEEVSGGSLNITYSDVQGGFTGEGNINEDPMFENSNYYLSDSSSCIDAGNPDARYNDPEYLSNPDSVRFPSKGGLRNDMGSYGGPGSQNLNYLITSIEIKGESMRPNRYFLGQNYPNPFNPKTTIKYSIPRNSFVSLKIYNVLGKELETLVNQMQCPGSYKIVFNGSRLSSGNYFLKLQTGSFLDIKKCILLK